MTTAAFAFQLLLAMFAGWVNRFFVRPDIEKIFNYRQDQLCLLEAEWKAASA